jgi:hypothetical protein
VLLLLLLLQGMDGSGGWGNFSGVAQDSSGWVTKLWDNMKAGTMMVRCVVLHWVSTWLFKPLKVLVCSMVAFGCQYRQ